MLLYLRPTGLSDLPLSGSKIGEKQEKAVQSGYSLTAFADVTPCLASRNDRSSSSDHPCQLPPLPEDLAQSVLPAPWCLSTSPTSAPTTAWVTQVQGLLCPLPPGLWVVVREI